MIRSNSSSEVGSLQCVSSNSSGTGCRPASPLDLRHQCPQRLLPLLLRGKVERRPALAGGERQQRRKQRRCLVEIVGRLRQQRLQLVEPRIGGVLAAGTQPPVRGGWRFWAFQSSDMAVCRQ
jgi:hypothetical protein